MTHIKNTHHLYVYLVVIKCLTVKIGGLNFQTLSFEFWHLEVEIVLYHEV
jgi:nitric oxide synthase oxygenase domain/subunit